MRLKVADVPLLGWFWPWAAAIEAAVGVLLSGRGGLVAVAAVTPILARDSEGASIDAGPAPLLACLGRQRQRFHRQRSPWLRVRGRIGGERSDLATL